VRAEDVAKVAVGPSKWRGGSEDFSPWTKLMTDIVTGDAFGVDRIDYLLRDSLHAGVGYGRFDHYRLIDTLRVLPGAADRPVIGIERGGIHAAEALQQARYFMFTQLYLHRVRRAYDKHLVDFLSAWLPGHKYPINIASHLALMDNEVLSAIHKAAAAPGLPGHDAARRIVCRQHFRVLYESRAEDLQKTLHPEAAIYAAAAAEFGPEDVRLDTYRQGSQPVEFAVLREDGQVVSSLQESEILNHIPRAAVAYVFVVPERRAEADKWLKSNQESILTKAFEEKI